LQNPGAFWNSKPAAGARNQGHPFHFSHPGHIIFQLNFLGNCNNCDKPAAWGSFIRL